MLNPTSIQDPFIEIMSNQTADAVVQMFKETQRNKELQTIDGIISLSLEFVRSLAKSLVKGPQFSDYYLLQDASVRKLNNDVAILRTRFLSTFQNLVSLEDMHLNSFNVMEQRVDYANKRLDKIESQIIAIENGQKTIDGIIVFSEDFGNLSFVDTNTEPERMPTLYDGYIALPEENTQKAPDISGSDIVIEKVNKALPNYPLHSERPVGFIYEGNYYGTKEQVRPEGGRWNLKNKQVAEVSAETDIFGSALTATTYLYGNSQDLNELLPNTTEVEQSSYVVVNLGLPEMEKKKLRKNIVDNNPESIWTMEYLIPTSENNTPDTTLEVSLLITLPRNIRTNSISITPYLQAGLEADLDIGSGGSESLINVDNVSPFSWAFPSQSIKTIRLTLRSGDVVETPYQLMTVNFKRLISHETDTQVVQE